MGTLGTDRESRAGRCHFIWTAALLSHPLGSVCVGEVTCQPVVQLTGLGSDSLSGFGGIGISVRDGVAVVGASSDGGIDRGAAYVFRRVGDSWMQEQRLLASDGATNDHFGISVSNHSDVILVGAWNADCAAGQECGAAYIREFRVLRFNGRKRRRNRRSHGALLQRVHRLWISVCLQARWSHVGVRAETHSQ